MRTYFQLIVGPVIVALVPDLTAGADETTAANVAAATASTSVSSSTTAESSASRRATRRRTGDTQYNWAWLAARYDTDGDGKLSPTEVPVSEEMFDRLDRTWDGTLTADDFDWSADGGSASRKRQHLPCSRSSMRAATAASLRKSGKECL